MLFVALCVSYARSPALLRFITASSTSCGLPISERSLPGILLLWEILLLLCSGVVQSVRRLMRCLTRPESQLSLCVLYLATLRCGDPAAALEVAAFESQSCSLLNCKSPARLLSLVVLHAYAIQAKAERLPLLRLSCTCCVKQGVMALRVALCHGNIPSLMIMSDSGLACLNFLSHNLAFSVPEMS
jgi:hypothetical protein